MHKIPLSLLQDIESCQVCSSIVGHKKFPEYSHGNLESPFMLLSEAPGKNSLTQAKYWVGAGGKLLRSALGKASLEELFYLTDIVKCWPSENGNNRKPHQVEINNCRRFINDEIEHLEPELILALGKVAAEYVLGRSIRIRDAHGKLFQINKLPRVLVMYHPSQIDLQMDRKIYAEQLKRLFAKLEDRDLAGLEAIFTQQPTAHEVETDLEMENHLRADDESTIGSFALPTPGNSITQNDIRKGQLRVTVNFKKYFPERDSYLVFIHEHKKYRVVFKHQGQRSHLLKFDSSLWRKLGIRAGNRVIITKTQAGEFLIEVIE